MITTNGFGSGAITISGWGFPSVPSPPWYEKVGFTVYINRTDSFEIEG